MRDATAVEDGDDTVVQIELDQSEAWGWLTFLTDLRLILAERVGIIEEGDDAADETRDDYLRAAYEWAGSCRARCSRCSTPPTPDLA